MRVQGERATLPPPVPIGELVEKMMSIGEGEVPSGRRAGSAPEDDGVQLDELPASAEATVLAEIGEAYLGRLGGRTHVPFTRTTREAALRVPLDHWAGFVLSLVDGAASIDEIVDASSLPEVEALRLLCELREQGLIDVRPRR